MNGHLYKRFAQIFLVSVLALLINLPILAWAGDSKQNIDSNFTKNLQSETPRDPTEERVQPDPTNTPQYKDIETIPFEMIPLYVDGVVIGEGMKFNGETYTSLRMFCQAVSDDLSIQWDEVSRTATVNAPGLVMEATSSEKYAIVNGRYLYVAGGIPNIDGNIMLPVRLLAKAFGVGITWDEESQCVEIDSKGAMPLESAEKFYDETDLMWLSRIINAESGNQNLEGKIAVGNVIMNRVKDPYCPDSIFDVIFDSKHGVQFTPTATGTIYLDPSEESVIAAKISLEGYNLVGDSLFFVNPDIGVTEWFSMTRTYVVTFGDHDFYA